MKEHKKNIKKHYDVSNDFFSEFMGEHMIYTTTHFRNKGESLTKSEANKLEDIANELVKNKVQNVLEIGVGWGSMLIYLAQKHKIKSTGITLSEEQYKFVELKINKLKLGKYIDVKLIDFFEVNPENKKYDAILSIGVMSHIKSNLLLKYYQKIYELLTEKGIYYQDSLTMGRQVRNIFSGAKFSGKDFFPGTQVHELYTLTQQAQKADLEVMKMFSTRKDYAKTARFWTDNLKKMSKNKYPEEILRKWIIGMTGVYVALEENFLNNYEIVFRKNALI